MSQEARLEAYVVQYTPNGTFLSVVNKKPNLVPSIADATMFHTATEAVLVQNKFNLSGVSTVQFVDITLEEIK